MKIISGLLKGRKIPIIKNAKYRPSTGRVKEAIFSILMSRLSSLDSLNVLDVFCGTGSLGLESLSRGASHVTFIDIELLHLKKIREFVEDISMLEKTDYLNLDATKLIKKQNITYDLVFIDPPYDKKMAQKSLSSLHSYGWLNNGAYLIVELSKREDITLDECYNILDIKVYGSTKCLILEYIG